MNAVVLPELGVGIEKAVVRAGVSVGRILLFTMVEMIKTAECAAGPVTPAADLKWQTRII